MVRASDKKLITDFEELVDIIFSSTTVDPFEGAGDKRKRIEYYLSSYERFCNYYFEPYCFAPFAWFHKCFPEFILNNPCAIYLLQWAREFAKSTHACLFMPIFLLCKTIYYKQDFLTGMILGSHDENMAAQKLIDIQANLESNQRLINDFGELMSIGNWESGQFKTKNDIPFYGFGKKQSPRGYKFKWKRPNYGAIDDLNDSRQLKNDAIAEEDKRWVMEELKPALWIKLWWLVVPQNKFNDNTVTALIENDEQIKSTALRVDMKDKDGETNWPENFTNEDIKTLEESEGAAFTRERMNTPFDEGTTIKAEWLNEWVEPLPFNKYDGVLVHYLDPSYKATTKSDYKAWVLLGKTGLHYDILKAWGERTDSKEMWEHAFHVDELVDEANTVKHAMEANFIQEDVHKKELERVETEQGRALRVFMDYRDKPAKLERIGTLAPLFKRGLIRFNKTEKDNAGMKLLRKQLLAIGEGSKVNDDLPDALEGGIWFIDKHGKKIRRPQRSGKFIKSKKRSI